MEFDWDEANETHIARHGVTRLEVETVLDDPLAAFTDSRIEDDELRFRQVGSTASGRLLVVAFTLRGELFGQLLRSTPTDRLCGGIERAVPINLKQATLTLEWS